MDALVAAMTAKEDSNFRLFSYVGDINSEAEKLQAHEDDVQKELDRYQAAADAQDSERQAKLQVTYKHPPSIGTPLQGQKTVWLCTRAVPVGTAHLSSVRNCGNGSWGTSSLQGLYCSRCMQVLGAAGSSSSGGGARRGKLGGCRNGA